MPSILSRASRRPSAVDPRHDPLRNHDRICDGGFQRWRRSPIPMCELPSGKDARRDRQNAFATLVHADQSAHIRFLFVIGEVLWMLVPID
jgi:hypothetical protein